MIVYISSELVVVALSSTLVKLGLKLLLTNASTFELVSIRVVQLEICFPGFLFFVSFILVTTLKKLILLLLSKSVIKSCCFPCVFELVIKLDLIYSCT